jgi:anhydro-N-acetylmuramic acid kinase
MMPKMRTALGLMSAASLDGIDAAMLVTDGVRISVFGPTFTFAYTPAERDVIRAATAAAASLADRAARPEPLRRAEQAVTAAHARAVAAVLAESGMSAEEIDVIGFHGHTVRHDPARRLTMQLGDAAGLAAATGIAVVADFRAADVAAGGEGAPLTPLYLAALVARSELPLPIAIVTADATAHVTVVGAGGAQDLVAFDSGPAFALLDAWTRRAPGGDLAAVEALAAAGSVDDAALNALLDHPYFDAMPPKSLPPGVATLAPLARLNVADGAATLVAFVAEAVAFGLDLLVDRPASLVLAGPGARLPSLAAALAERTKAEVVTADRFDWSVDHLEAQAFAFLAVRHLDALPLSLPATTGVPKPCPGGVLALPSARSVAVPPSAASPSAVPPVAVPPAAAHPDHERTPAVAREDS